jgi:hypothetical protein
MATLKDKDTQAPHDGEPVALESIPVRVFTHRQAGQWSAIAVDYTIVGQGDTHDEAMQRLGELLCSYLESCVRDGISIADARRPIGRRWWLELRLEQILGRVLHRVHRVSDGARTERFNLPAGGVDGCQPA